jgi:hypothetical protein
MQMNTCRLTVARIDVFPHTMVTVGAGPDG